jgi:hypothetical protein
MSTNIYIYIYIYLGSGALGSISVRADRTIRKFANKASLALARRARAQAEAGSGYVAISGWHLAMHWALHTRAGNGFHIGGWGTSFTKYSRQTISKHFCNTGTIGHGPHCQHDLAAY